MICGSRCIEGREIWIEGTRIHQVSNTYSLGRGDKEVIGFHNWIQFYLQEKAGAVDYKGFMSSDRNPHLMTIQFAWRGETKPKGSMLIGTSPEFELALYTVCY